MQTPRRSMVGGTHFMYNSRAIISPFNSGINGQENACLTGITAEDVTHAIVAVDAFSKTIA
ncbi:hypothetical protein PJ912_27360 [Pectobacterium colocasium]|uniref:hypothetical protein n=1 Tax=Pectobacterium TaxID=122277 RepID=UPI003D74210E